MKEIKAIIRPELLDRVMHELRVHPDIPGVTIGEVSALGRERSLDPAEALSHTHAGFGHQRMLKLELVVPDNLAQTVRDLIATHARTGHPGDGLVFIIPIDSGVRIRSGEPIGGA